MGIWIKEIPVDYWEHTSFCFDDVMLWKEDKVYVMDNHKSAAWCWLQQCKDDACYNFMHIDCHYDMGDCYRDEDLEQVKRNPHMSYDEMMNLERSDGECKILRWDNYIRYVYELRPNWFTNNLFITQKEGDICNEWGRKRMNISEKEELYLPAWLGQYVLEVPQYTYDIAKGSEMQKWIVNLDLDFFFYNNGANIRVQLFSDDYIREVAKLLEAAMRKIQILTIAISPDCLVGDDMKEKWDNGFRVLEIMSEEISALRHFPFPKKYNSYKTIEHSC